MMILSNKYVVQQNTPTNKIQTHHMSTDRSHLKAHSLAKESACIFIN